MHARPAWEPTEAIAVTVFWFGIVFDLGGEGVKCSVIGYIFDGGHVCAVGVSVDVMRTRTGHQFFSHVVDGDGILVGCRALVALVGDVDESGGIGVEGELVGLCAFLCRLVSFTGYNIVKKNPVNSAPVDKKYDLEKTILRSGTQYYV